MDIEKSELISLLQNNEAFSTAPLDSLEELVEASEIRELSPAQDLIHQGASGESIWLLLEGHLDVLVDDQLVNQVENRGDVVGEISAISLTPATATVRSTQSGSALCIPHKVLNEVIKKSPPLAASMLRSMAKYLGKR